MLNVSRDLLLSRMEVASKVCPTRTPKDILKWAKLECDGENLTITATDHEIGVRMQDHCDGEPITFLLPAAQTVSVLRAMRSEDLHITVISSGIEVKGVKEFVRLPYMDAADYPGWEHAEDQQTTIRGLQGPVERSAWALDEANSRYAMSGFHLKRYPDGLFVESTDSRCASREPIQLLSDAEAWAGIVEPRGMKLAADILIGDIAASLGRSSIEMSAAGKVVYARLLEGQFPRVTAVFPKTFDAQFEITVAELVRVVKLAATVTDKESSGLDIDVGHGVLSVRSGATDKGNADIEVPIPCDDACKTSLDSSILARMLATLDPLDVLTWGLNHESPHQFSVREWKGLIMPLSRGE